MIATVGWLVSVVLAAFVVAGCGYVGPPPADGLIRSRPMNGYPGALVKGTLVQRGSCLGIQMDPDLGGNFVVAIWPPEARLAGGTPPTVLDGFGRTWAALGEHIDAAGGGGTYGEMESLLSPGTEVPLACRDQEFWLVGPPPWLW